MYSSTQYRRTEKLKTKYNFSSSLFPKLPNKKYQIIYCDPPWDYGGVLQYNQNAVKERNPDWKKPISVSSSHMHYPTVSLEVLKTLDIQSIADDDCLLYMWTTNPKLAEAIELGAAWGFQYKTVAFIWNKGRFVPGNYTGSLAEQVLVFKKNKGKIPQPRGLRNVRQLVEDPFSASDYVFYLKKLRTKHSKKPKEIREKIHFMHPTNSKIEIFSRQDDENSNYFENWDFWGLESLQNKDKLSIFSLT